MRANPTFSEKFLPLALASILLTDIASFGAEQPLQAVIPQIVGPATSPNPAKFIPVTVSLTQRCSVATFANGQPTGVHTLPEGVMLLVKGIKVDKVVVSLAGGVGEIPATATDLLEQMVNEYERLKIK